MQINNNPDGLCWCESGIRYKDCHLNRHKQIPLQHYDIDAELRRVFTTKQCLHPGAATATCRGGIVNAHTVHKAGSLSRIADKGHVIAFHHNTSLQEMIESGGRVGTKRIGINRASTFTGFCQFHDSETFSPIERQPFRASNAQQNFLFAYRAICREIFTKTAALKLTELERCLDRGMDIERQIVVQGYLKARRAGLEAGLRILQSQKKVYDNCLSSSDFSRIQYYVLELHEVPDVMTSFGCNPEYDFEASPLQNLVAIGRAGGEIDLITCSIVATGAGGAIIFSWLNETHSVCTKLIRSLDRLDDLHISNAVMRFVFEYAENVFCSPLWWESLKAVQREKIQDRAFSDYPHPATCLVDDSEDIVSWTIRARVTNIAVC